MFGDRHSETPFPLSCLWIPVNGEGKTHKLSRPTIGYCRRTAQTSWRRIRLRELDLAAARAVYASAGGSQRLASLEQCAKTAALREHHIATPWPISSRPPVRRCLITELTRTWGIIVIKTHSIRHIAHRAPFGLHRVQVTAPRLRKLSGAEIGRMTYSRSQSSAHHAGLDSISSTRRYRRATVSSRTQTTRRLAPLRRPFQPFPPRRLLGVQGQRRERIGLVVIQRRDSYGNDLRSRKG